MAKLDDKSKIYLIVLILKISMNKLEFVRTVYFFKLNRFRHGVMSILYLHYSIFVWSILQIFDTVILCFTDCEPSEYIPDGQYLLTKHFAIK